MVIFKLILELVKATVIALQETITILVIVFILVVTCLFYYYKKRK